MKIVDINLDSVVLMGDQVVNRPNWISRMHWEQTWQGFEYDVRQEDMIAALQADVLALEETVKDLEQQVANLQGQLDDN